MTSTPLRSKRGSCDVEVGLFTFGDLISDPIRVFQEFATLDLLSGGRAEIMAGRGAFTESFPLFGYRLEDYETLFEEHLDLLLQVDWPAPVTWSGHHRPGALRRRPG